CGGEEVEVIAKSFRQRVVSLNRESSRHSLRQRKLHGVIVRPPVLCEVIDVADFRREQPARIVIRRCGERSSLWIVAWYITGRVQLFGDAPIIGSRAHISDAREPFANDFPFQGEVPVIAERRDEAVIVSRQEYWPGKRRVGITDSG